MVSLSRSFLPSAPAYRRRWKASKWDSPLRFGKIWEPLGFVNWRSQGQVLPSLSPKKAEGRGGFSQAMLFCGFFWENATNSPIIGGHSHWDGIVGEGPLLQSQCQEPMRLPNHTLANRHLLTPNTRCSYSDLFCLRVLLMAIDDFDVFHLSFEEKACCSSGCPGIPVHGFDLLGIMGTAQVRMQSVSRRIRTWFGATMTSTTRLFLSLNPLSSSSFLLVPAFYHICVIPGLFSVLFYTSAGVMSSSQPLASKLSQASKSKELQPTFPFASLKPQPRIQQQQPKHGGSGSWLPTPSLALSAGFRHPKDRPAQSWRLVRHGRMQPPSNTPVERGEMKRQRVEDVNTKTTSPMTAFRRRTLVADRAIQACHHHEADRIVHVRWWKRHRKSTNTLQRGAAAKHRCPLTAGPSGCTTAPQTSKVASGGSHRNGMYWKLRWDLRYVPRDLLGSQKPPTETPRQGRTSARKKEGWTRHWIKFFCSWKQVKHRLPRGWADQGCPLAVSAPFQVIDKAANEIVSAGAGPRRSPTCCPRPRERHPRFALTRLLLLP